VKGITLPLSSRKGPQRRETARLKSFRRRRIGRESDVTVVFVQVATQRFHQERVTEDVLKVPAGVVQVEVLKTPQLGTNH
jgi:hypothetical protein